LLREVDAADVFGLQDEENGMKSLSNLAAVLSMNYDPDYVW